MPSANYPAGFPAGVTIRGVPIINTNPGRIFWVYNGTAQLPNQFGGANVGNGDFNHPYSTVAYAITQCVADRGDIVFVKPGHAETITASTAWGTTAGVAIVGLGQGANRPTFTFSATASKITLTGNNLLLHNLLFISSIDAVVNVINVSGADVVLSNIEYREDTQVQCTDCIIATATATRFKVAGFKYRAFDATAGTVAGIALIGMDSPDISELDVIGLWSAGFIDCRTTAVTNLRVYNVIQYRSLGTGEILVKDTVTGSTGMIGPNIYARLSANTTNITEVVTGATFVVMGGTSTAGVGGNTFLVANLANEQGMAINWTNSTDA
jgi:hypothetical protein